MKTPPLVLSLVLLASALPACGGDVRNGTGARPFDGDAAFAVLEHLCRIGPRAPGTKTALEARAWMEKELRRHTDDVRVLEFEGREPGAGRTYALANLFARLHPAASRRVLLVTHWDTRLWADLDPDPAKRNVPIPGANDGASGVAVLLELARVFAEKPPAVGVDILLTDGEDLGRPGSKDYWQGAIHFAREDGPFADYRPAWSVVVDLVGDRDLKILKDPFSVRTAPALVDRIWAIARNLGHGERFPERAGPPIQDDQVPLHQGLGIPSVLLIDFDYGPRHGWFHTVEDTPDKCSAASLRAVGEVLSALVYEEAP